VRVLVDPEGFLYERTGGARYCVAVCRGLRAAGVQVDVPLIASGTSFEPGRFRLDRYRAWPRRLQWLRRELRWRSVLLSRRLFHHRLAHGNHDVTFLISWNYDTEIVAYRHRAPYVMVCHDTMRSLTIPAGALDSSPDALHRQLYFARRAARVVCVSEATRRDLLSSVSIPEERAVVVPTANLLPLFATTGAPVPGLPPAYFAFIGARQARKNFDGTVRALVPLLTRPGGPSLVATGRLDLWERDLVNDLGVADRVLGIDVDDAQLVTLYEQAIGLLYPSFYEGFGLPVLEAMSLGCPVVTSSVSSLPEVAGDAALLVNPADYAALLQAAERLVNEPELRVSLAGAGRARAAQFSLDRMMRGLLEQLHAAAATRA